MLYRIPSAMPRIVLATVAAVLALPLFASEKLRYYYPVPAADPAQTLDVDVCVYGGTPGGVTSAIQAARMGKKAVLVAFGRHVGGMTSGGLTATDIGNRRAIGGMANEFYQHVGKVSHFRPSEAEATFRAMLDDAGVPVVYEHRLKSVEKSGNRITVVKFENGNNVKAKMFIDATYEGDLFAAAGVSYHVGREANSVYDEKYNGICYRNQHQFVTRVDPYRTEGDPKSGLLWGISADPPGKQGDGDKRIQAYNFRMWLTRAPDRLPFPKPSGYDRDRYLLLARYLKAQQKPAVPFQIHSGDCNNEGGFSTDYIGGNYAWPEGDYATRERIFQDHVKYQQGLVWFAANDPEVPEHIRAELATVGLPKAEFVETEGWPHQLYIREGRRMISDYVMTEHNCQGRKTVEDSVGLAAYTMDSHNCQRLVIGGAVRNEGDVQVGVPRPYSISFRSIIPKESQCANLLVPVCLASSHIAYGSIRMEPVFMILGQSAGTAAVMAIDGNISVQKLPYAQLRERLLADQQILDWNDANSDSEFQTSIRVRNRSGESLPDTVSFFRNWRFRRRWSRDAGVDPNVENGVPEGEGPHRSRKSC
jgi:thioredoxin reductase